MGIIADGTAKLSRNPVDLLRDRQSSGWRVDSRESGKDVGVWSVDLVGSEGVRGFRLSPE